MGRLARKVCESRRKCEADDHPLVKTRFILRQLRRFNAHFSFARDSSDFSRHDFDDGNRSKYGRLQMVFYLLHTGDFVCLCYMTKNSSFKMAAGSPCPSAENSGVQHSLRAPMDG